MRLLLALALNPAFAAACATPGVVISSSPLESALAAHPSLRVVVVNALVGTIPQAGRDAAGRVERVVGVFEAAASALDADVREAATRGIATLDLCLHPRVPPLLRASRKQLAAETFAEPKERSPSPEPEPTPPAPPVEPAPAPIVEPTPAPVASTQLHVPVEPVVRPDLPRPEPVKAVEQAPVVEAPILPLRPPPAPLAELASIASTSKASAPMAVDEDDEPLPTINLGFTDDEESDEAMEG